MSESKITASDAVLVALLQKNARVTNKELARAAGIAESTCLDRVRSLQQRGVITGYHAEVDLPSIGRPIRAMVHVRLQPKTTESVRDFQADVRQTPGIISVSTLMGADDFVVELAVPDVEHLGAFVMEHITSRPDVADSRTSIVYEQIRNQAIEPLVSD